jgi:hypothetical protein
MSEWRTQIEEDSGLRDSFHQFIDEFSSIPLYMPFFVLVVSGDDYGA